METNTAATAKTAKLIRKLQREYDRAITAEENAPTLKKAYRLAAASELCLRRLQAARAGQPLPEPKLPRTALTKAREGFAALALVGRTIARAMARQAALRKAQAAAAFARAARKLAALVRKSLRSAVAAVARLALRTVTTSTATTVATAPATAMATTAAATAPRSMLHSYPMTFQLAEVA